MKTKGEDSHQQAKDRGLEKNQPVDTLISDFRRPNFIKPLSPVVVCYDSLCCLVSKSCLTLLQPHGLYVAHQAPLSIGFSSPEYWSGLPLPSPGDLPDPGIEPRFLTLQAYSSPSEPQGSPAVYQLQFN